MFVCLGVTKVGWSEGGTMLVTCMILMCWQDVWTQCTLEVGGTVVLTYPQSCTIKCSLSEALSHKAVDAAE